MIGGLNIVPDHRKNVKLADQFPDIQPEKACLMNLTIDPTHSCNFRCPGCIERLARIYSKITSLDIDTICKNIDRFVNLGGKELDTYGGEPTLHPNFPAMISHSAKHELDIRVATNGSMLSEQNIADALISAALKTKVAVRVSLNAGTAKTHERLHRVRGYFHKVIRGMQMLSQNKVRLDISFIVEDDNAGEIQKAYDIATEVGAAVFYLRPKTGLHGIDLVPLNQKSRDALLDFVNRIMLCNNSGPVVRIETWYLNYLETGTLPNTAKSYPTCFYCAASRIVITPPDPGIAWSCTYWRGSPRFFVANLSDAPLGSDEFEQCRIQAIQRINPIQDCARVICNRDAENRYLWNRLKVNNQILSPV